jgi:hemolysin activation/secretion protein
MKKLITLSLATTTILLAGAPTISDVVHETTPPKEVVPKTESLIQIGGAEKYAPAMVDDKSGRTVFVKAFKITGALHMDVNKLQEKLLSYANKELTFTQLQEAASIITKAYREAGYFVARAYIPVQNMQEEIVEIAIIEGNYGEFRLHNTSLVKDSIVQGMLDDIKDANIVSTNTLERAMLIINDTPGAKVTQADVMPGKAVGTSDFAIKTEATPRYDGFIIGDNYGSRYTGYNRLMVGLNLNSLAGIGDKLNVVGMLSNGADLKYGRIAYSVPLMPNGLRGELSYADTQYSLTGKYANLDAYGTARTVEGSLTYPFIRTRHETLNLTSSLDIKKLNDHQNGAVISDKDATVFSLGAKHTKDYKFFGLDAKTDSVLTLTCGNLKFNDVTSRATDTAGANTQGRYNKISGNVEGNIAFNQTNSLSTNLQFQKALGHKNLDGSEDFILGGSNGVKVYPISELSAEDGILLNTELFQTLPTMVGITQKAGVFYDIGKVYMADSSKVTTFQSRLLQDIGVGYYASYKSLFAKVQLAYVVGGGTITSEPSYSNKLLVQAGWSF